VVLYHICQNRAAASLTLSSVLEKAKNRASGTNNMREKKKMNSNKPVKRLCYLKPPREFLPELLFLGCVIKI
jgi:hypothetical protein